jgi:hypothetical protein
MARKQSITDTGGYTMHYGSDDEKNYFGMGFLLQKSIHYRI